MTSDRKPKQEPRSPLSTTSNAKAAKAALIAQWGRDTDGAYRTRDRLDKADKAKPE